MASSAEDSHDLISIQGADAASDISVNQFNEDRSREHELTSHLGRRPSLLPATAANDTYSPAFESNLKEMKEGLLLKKLSSSGSWRQYWFRFIPEKLQLVYFANKEDAIKGHVRRVVPIGYISVEKIEDEDRLFHKQIKTAHKQATFDICTLRIHIWTPLRLFTLSASSDEVANEWISAIESKLKTFSTEQDIKDKKEALIQLDPLLRRQYQFQRHQFHNILQSLESTGLFSLTPIDKCREGYLDMMKTDRSWKQYYVILFKDSFAYYDTEDKKFPKGVVSLESIFSIKIMEERKRLSTTITPTEPTSESSPKTSSVPRGPRVFRIVTPLRQFTFKAKHREAMKDWILALQQYSSSVSQVYNRDDDAIEGESVKDKKLVLLYQDEKGKTIRFKVKTDNVTMGRSTKCDVSLEDKKASRNHARLMISKKGVPILYDLGSMCGTEVNGKRITKTAIKNGDKLLLGGTEIIFCVENKTKKLFGIL
jgi:hypothetical protein